jgi:hypothetical protein
MRPHANHFEEEMTLLEPPMVKFIARLREGEQEPANK